MAHDTEQVKSRTTARKIADWVDDHPRRGWYFAALLFLNFLLNLADAFDVNLFPFM